MRNNTVSQYDMQMSAVAILESPHTSLSWPSQGQNQCFGEATVWRWRTAAMGGHTATYDKWKPAGV
ncbi:unnamed protein product [Staurois parvus]|uniref:Uncharacterized protein n=1 Tax=Staurois parvus TaxID=386267 RepID=A0ABN9GVC9_9NEOB|nr:unnamed protein product [Staurois parvus]